MPSKRCDPSDVPDSLPHSAGEFDERVEHEGCLAKDEKWIARIWRHTSRVPPPFGLRDDYKVEAGVTDA